VSQTERMEKLNSELQESLSAKCRIEVLDSKISSLEKTLQYQEGKLEDAKQILEKEKIDVEKLEKLSLQSILQSFLGSKSEKMEKERLELLAAETQYGEIRSRIENVRSETEILREERKCLENTAEKYESLFKEKRTLLRKEGTCNEEYLLKLEEKILKEQVFLKELEEAIKAGDQVAFAVSDAKKYLSNAMYCGYGDFLWLDIISEIGKYRHLWHANDAIKRIEQYMQTFRIELADVKLKTEAKMLVGPGTVILDVMFDNLFTDMLALRKIDDTLKSVIGLQHEIDRIMNKLYELKKQHEKELNQLQNKLKLLVENG